MGRQEEIAALAAQHQADVFETSAKAGQGVGDIFQCIVTHFQTRAHTGGPSTLLTRRGELDDALYSCAVPVLCLCCERCGARAALLRAVLLPLVPLTRRRVESVW